MTPARYWFTETPHETKRIELEVGPDGCLYRRSRLSLSKREPEALAVSTKVHGCAPGAPHVHGDRCMCRACRIEKRGVYCPATDDSAPADGVEPNRAVWDGRGYWRDPNEVAAERAQRERKRDVFQEAEHQRQLERERVVAEKEAEAQRLLEHRRATWPPPVLEHAPGAGYSDAHRYEGVVLAWGKRSALRKPGVPTQRDIEILTALWRYRVLSTSHVKELWWPQAQLRKAQERMKEIFDLGLVDKFRPPAIRGSYQWSYCLDRAGHDLLKDLDIVPAGERFRPRAVVDFKTVLHALQLNAWVIAYRSLLGKRFIEWRGEPDSRIEFSADQRAWLAKQWSPQLQLERPQPIWPDAALELDRGGLTQTLLIEFDRTRRPDKNASKFLRYDALLCSWWRATTYGERGRRPWVVFVCQDEASLISFAEAAHVAMTSSAASYDERHPGRQLTLFVLEADMHCGNRRAWRLPEETHGEFLPRPVTLPG